MEDIFVLNPVTIIGSSANQGFWIFLCNKCVDLYFPMTSVSQLHFSAVGMSKFKFVTAVTVQVTQQQNVSLTLVMHACSCVLK